MRGSKYGGRLSATFQRAACRLQLGLAGHAIWNGGRPAPRLLRRARRASADGVFISVQAFDANGARLVRALRRTLDHDVVTHRRRRAQANRPASQGRRPRG